MNNSTNTSSIPNSFLSTKQASTIQSSTTQISSKPPSHTSKTIIIKFEDCNNTTTDGSTIQEDTPSPSYQPSDNFSTLLISHTQHNFSNLSLNRPATPISRLTSSSILSRKRSLTLLSSQNITTRSTYKL